MLLADLETKGRGCGRGGVAVSVHSPKVAYTSSHVVLNGGVQSPYDPYQLAVMSSCESMHNSRDDDSRDEEKDSNKRQRMC